MKEMIARHPVAGILAALAVLGVVEFVVRRLPAQEGPDWKQGLPEQHDSIWLVHDPDRPEPPPVEPGAHRDAAPADAIVLFDGTNLTQWERAREEGGDAGWKVENGYMEGNDSGSIRTRAAFRDCQLHLEYMAPAEPRGVSQARGNSGIIFMESYEVQVLDNRDNPTYADGYIGAVYGQHPPLVNAARKPGEWQTYDIVFRAPRFEGRRVLEPGRVTVFLNGIVVQHNAEIRGDVAWRQRAEYRRFRSEGPLLLQDHGDKQPVRFRNIWVRRLDLSPAAIDNRP
jgi:hypothetical protein